MKRAQTSMSLFLGVWLAVLMAGYIASRANVFAAGGQNNCVPCTCCEELTTWWATGDTNDHGFVSQGTNQPAVVAAIGLDCSGTTTIYGNGCDVGQQMEEIPITQVNMVTYSSASLSCTITIGPPPAGIYVCTNGTGMQPTNYSTDQTYCGE